MNLRKGTIAKPNGYTQLLSIEADTKTRKGSARGYLTGILYLAPANEAGRGNLCPMASAECKAFCLYDSGMAQVFPTIKAARIAKTHLYFDNREQFLANLRYDIAALIATAQHRGMIPAVRINGTSDLPQLALQMAREFPEVQFYDYTKIPNPQKRVLPNYHLTFSWSGENLPACIDALEHGINVAVPFDAMPAVKGRRAGDALPETWQGYKVIDGDESDLRFLDESGVIVGLRHKGAKAHRAGASQFIQSTRRNDFVSVESLQLVA